MANARRRANRDRMFQQLLSVGYDGGTAGSIANTPNWDQTNKRFKAAMASPPGKPQPAPTPPPAPEIIKPPVQRQATQSSVGQGVRQARGSRKRTRLSDLRISRPRVNTQLAIGAGGTGLNIGGY